MIIDALQQLAVDIDSLTPLPGNPRVGDAVAVARSLDRFGQRKPIVVGRDGVVIAGNHTLEAARLLGWSEIAAVVVDDDEQTAMAFALADNRTADLGTYNEELLLEALHAVEDDPSLLEAVGYTREDIDALVSARKAPQTMIPQPRRPLGKAGTEAWERIWSQRAQWINEDIDNEFVLVLCETYDERAILRPKVLRDGEWRERVALRALDAQIIEMLAELGFSTRARESLAAAAGSAFTTSLDELDRLLGDA